MTSNVQQFSISLQKVLSQMEKSQNCACFCVSFWRQTTGRPVSDLPEVPRLTGVWGSDTAREPAHQAAGQVEKRDKCGGPAGPCGHPGLSQGQMTPHIKRDGRETHTAPHPRAGHGAVDGRFWVQTHAQGSAACTLSGRLAGTACKFSCRSPYGDPTQPAPAPTQMTDEVATH